MVILRFSAVQLAVVAAILGGCLFAQEQDSNDLNAEFERLCFVGGLFTPYYVGRDFSLELSFRETPLPNVQVILTPSGELTDAGGHPRGAITAKTDSSGTAHFSAVPSGKYTVAAKNALEFPSNEVTVDAKAHFEKKVLIEWPLVPLPVRTLRGALITQAAEKDAERPLQLATVELLELRSSKVLETQSTMGDGSYEFSSTRPGLYVVRVIPPAADEKTIFPSGDIAIELDPAAMEPSIPDLKVEQSKCAGTQLFRRDAKGNW